MVGYGLTTLLDWGKQKIGKTTWVLAGVLILLLNVILVWPFWNGEVIRSQGKILPGERVKVPAYWFEASQWLLQQEDFFRILPLPMSKTYNTAYFWGEGYSGGDLTRWLTAQPVLNVNTEETFKVPWVIAEAIENKSRAKDISKLMGYLNTKYLLLRHDTRWDFLRWHEASFSHEEENIKFFLDSGDFELDKKFGELEFYKIPDDYLLPRFYAADSIITIDGEAEALLDLAVFLYPDRKQPFDFKENPSPNKPSFYWRMPKGNNGGLRDFHLVNYEFDLAENGTFELLLRNENFTQRYPSLDSLSFSVNGGVLQEREILAIKDNLISLGEVKLEAGKTIIDLHLPEPPDLLAKGVEFPLKLISGKQEMASMAIRDFWPGESFQIAFKAKRGSGLYPVIIIWQNFVDASEPIFEKPSTPFFLSELKTSYSATELTTGQDWQSYQFPISLHPLAKVFGISLLSRSSVYEKSENHFDEIEIRPVFDNPMILRNTEKRVQMKTPRISAQKVSPTKYRVSVEGAEAPFWLVFSESFHSAWKINIEAEKGKLNGFANGWLISQTGDYELTIYFDRQKYLYFGIAISLGTLLIISGYLLVKKLRYNARE